MKVIKDEKATPDKEVNQLLPFVVDFFFWLLFWFVTLVVTVCTGLMVSSFSAAAPVFFDLFDFLFALFDFLLASPPPPPPLTFTPVLWLELELVLPSTSPAPAIWAVFRFCWRSRSMNSDLKFTQTLTCKQIVHKMSAFHLTVKCPLGLQYSWPPVGSPSMSSSDQQFSPRLVSKDCPSSPNSASDSSVRNSKANAPIYYCTNPSDADAPTVQSHRVRSVFDSYSDQA